MANTVLNKTQPSLFDIEPADFRIVPSDSGFPGKFLGFSCKQTPNGIAPTQQAASEGGGTSLGP